MTKNRKKILSKNSGGGGDEECFFKRPFFNKTGRSSSSFFLKTSPNRIRTQQSNRRETFLVAGKKRAESAGRFSDLRLLRFRVDYVFIVKIG